MTDPAQGKQGTLTDRHTHMHTHTPRGCTEPSKQPNLGFKKSEPG